MADRKRHDRPAEPEPTEKKALAHRPRATLVSGSHRHVDAIAELMPNSPLETRWTDPPSMRRHGREWSWWRRLGAFVRRRTQKTRAVLPVSIFMLSAMLTSMGPAGPV